MDNAPGFPPIIGPFAVLGVLGEGGMAVVYRARQAQPKRIVALKLIKPGLASPSALRRFEHEVELLGHLQHPGIAQIFEAGTASGDSGSQPYFAMELIEGTPLTEFAIQRDLDLKERLALFCKVCDAVQYAHRKGIVHRDLKPGNIIVDHEGQPKILDFGIARVTDGDVQITTMHTEVGQIIGTLSYMSPEQAGGDNTQVDQRSDVYALGVILQELLTGHLPYDLRDKMLHEVIQMIQEEDPQPLSTFERTLHGDLETIVMKSLTKERDRRYADAGELRSDIDRFLHDEPIAARPPSMLYQLRKFARRNKVLVTSVVGILLALVIGLIGTLRGMLEAKKQETIALEKARHAEQSASFLKTILSGVDAAVAQGRDTALLRMLLDQSAERIDRELQDAPLIKAEMRDTIGRTYYAMTDYASAQEHFQQAIKLFAQELGPDNIETLRVRGSLAGSLSSLGQRQAAREELDDALAIAESVYGPESDVVDALNGHLMTLLLANEDLDAAWEVVPKVLDYRRKHLGELHPKTLIALTTMGLLNAYQGYHQEAENYLLQSLRGHEQELGLTHPETLRVAHNLARFYTDADLIEKAEALLQETVTRCEQVLDGEHLMTWRTQAALGVLYRRTDRIELADEAFRRAEEGFRRLLPPDHPQLVSAITQRGFLYLRAGEFAKALPFLEQVYEHERASYGKDHRQTWLAYSNIAEAKVGLGQVDDAIAMRAEVIDYFRRALGPDHSQTLEFLDNLGNKWQREGFPQHAEPLLRDAWERRRATAGKANSATLKSAYGLGLVLMSRSRHVEAAPLLGDMFLGWLDQFGAEDFFTENSADALFNCLQQVPEPQEYADAIQALANWWHERRPNDTNQRRTLKFWHAQTLLNEQHWENAEELLLEVSDAQLESASYDDPEVNWTLAHLAVAYLGQERWDEAESLLLDSVDLVSQNHRSVVAGFLARVYQAMEQPEDAAAWQELAER